jgi:hypothetical protein
MSHKYGKSKVHANKISCSSNIKVDNCNSTHTDDSDTPTEQIMARMIT